MERNELINRRTDTYTGIEMLLYINNKEYSDFSDFAAAILGLGTGVVVGHLKKLHPKLRKSFVLF